MQDSALAHYRAAVAHLLEAVGACSVIALQEEGEEGGQMLPALPLHSLKPFHTPPHLSAQTQHVQMQNDSGGHMTMQDAIFSVANRGCAIGTHKLPKKGALGCVG